MRITAKFAGIAILLLASLPAACQPAAAVINASLCDVVNHPFKFAGKLVRVRVQEAFSWFGNPVLIEPLSADFKVDLTYKPCVANVEFHGRPPRNWLAGVTLRVVEGPIPRNFQLLTYGPVVTVIAKVKRSFNPQRKARIRRDSTGKIVETNFWDSGSSVLEPEVRLVIERLIEE